MISMDDKNLRQLQRDIQVYAKKALPFANRAALNEMAFVARERWQDQIKSGFVNRNKFTERSIRVVQDRRELNIRNQKSVVGSVAEYLAIQEFGGRKTASRGKKPLVPTSAASGERGSGTRLKAVRKNNYVSRMRLKKKTRGRFKSKKQEFTAKIADAVNSGNRFVYHKTAKGTEGFFKITGGRKGAKDPLRRAKLRMIYSTAKSSYVVRQRPMLQPSINVAQRMGPAIYLKKLKFQAKRHKLPGS